MPRLKKSAPKSAKKKMPSKFPHQGSADAKLTSPVEKKAIAMSDSTKEVPGKKVAGNLNTRAMADKNKKKKGRAGNR